MEKGCGLMTTKTQHTALPWVESRNHSGPTVRIEYNGEGYVNDDWVIVSEMHGPDADANAAFICKVVNNHEKLVSALREIVEWKMPETGKFWVDGDGIPTERPMSYSACYGSNGERDYIRNLARTVLAQLGE